MKRRNNFSGKPYNRCLSCHHRGMRCDGPRTAGLELARWCEYMRDLKEANGLTNAYIAEQADVSIKTVERLMAGSVEQDILRDTARRIENVIIGSTSKYPCYLAFEEEHGPDLKELERVLSDNQDYKKALDGIHASYQAEMQTIRDEAKGKIDYLLGQVERLRGEIDYLRLENDRKARVIDKLLEYEA